MTNQQANEPILTFEGKQYNINELPNQIKEIIKGLQAADNQLRLYEETLKVLALGRQSLSKQLKDSLSQIKPIE